MRIDIIKLDPLQRKRFGRRVRALRLARGLTQPELARSIGRDRCSISNIEHGRSGISTAKFGRLKRALGCTDEDLLGKARRGA